MASERALFDGGHAMMTAGETTDVLDLLVELIDDHLRRLTPRGKDALDPMLDLRNDVVLLADIG